MRLKSLVMAGLGAAGIALAASSLQAAPASGLIAAMERDAERARPVENVTWYGRRHCHWHYGYRHCYGYYPYRRWDYGHYGYDRPYRYHYGYGHPYRYHYGYRRGWY
jgi:hypothetical protein